MAERTGVDVHAHFFPERFIRIIEESGGAFGASVDRSKPKGPVLVVGGSLVGLSMSLFLGRLGVRHMLVERHAGTSIHPRGRGNNVRTMELFRRAAIEPDIKAAASLLADDHGILQTPTLVGDAGDWLFKEIDPGGGLARFSPTGWCLCSQNDLEPVLLDHAREHGGDLRFATELLSFESDSTGVTAVALSRAGQVTLHPGGAEVLRAEDELIVAGSDEDLERLPTTTQPGATRL